MSKQEFLRQLEQLLYDIPESERREAMEYYQNYFEDAGPKKEAQIIDELGSPQEVAANIKRDLFGEEEKEYDFTKEMNEKKDYRQPKNGIGRNLVIISLIVLTFPLWVGIVAVAFALLVTVIALVFALFIAVIAIVAAFLILGCALTGAGFANIFAGFPAIGLILIAIGMFFLAFSVLGIIVVVWGCGRILPWTLRAFVRLCKRPFQKRGAVI